MGSSILNAASIERMLIRGKRSHRIDGADIGSAEAHRDDGGTLFFDVMRRADGFTIATKLATLPPVGEQHNIALNALPQSPLDHHFIESKTVGNRRVPTTALNRNFIRHL